MSGGGEPPLEVTFFVENEVWRPSEVSEHPDEGLILFRRYRDDEPVFARDRTRTRTFFDLRGHTVRSAP